MLKNELKNNISISGRISAFYIRNKLNKWLLFFIALVLVILLLTPIFWMIKISLTPRAELFTIPLKWIPSKINLEGYKDFLSRDNFLRYYLNSIIVSSGTVIICLFAGILAAYSFSRFKFWGKNSLMAITLSTQMFPWALLIISIYILFMKIKMFDTYFGLILAHSTFALPLTIWIIKSYFDTVPKELEEAALIDGCSRTKILLKIILPISYPGVIAASIYVFIFSWNDFIFGLTLTSKDSMRILAPGMALSFIGEMQYLWIEMMASSIVVTAPVAIIFLLLQRYFITGLTGGAVKG